MTDIGDRIRKRIQTAYRDPAGFPASAPSPVATGAGITADEQRLGFAIPPLLKRLYLEVGNGGWGPGYGLLGLTGGMRDDTGRTAVEDYLLRTSGPDPDEPDWRWPEGLLPICHWGCAIYSCVDCFQQHSPMILFDPNADKPSLADAFFPEQLKFEEWIGLWADGVNLWDRMYGDDGPMAAELGKA